MCMVMMSARWRLLGGGCLVEAAGWRLLDEGCWMEAAAPVWMVMMGAG